MIKHRGYVKAARWAGAKEYLLTVPIRFGLSSEIISETKSLFRTTIVFELEGERENINKFQKQMAQDAEVYNNRKDL